jgi:hypothetical protein
VKEMTRGKGELAKEWNEQITEGNKTYTLHLMLYKSTLKILDEAGNAINVDKRDDKIKIQKWGTVVWHRKEGKKLKLQRF